MGPWTSKRILGWLYWVNVLSKQGGQLEIDTSFYYALGFPRLEIEYYNNIIMLYNQGFLPLVFIIISQRTKKNSKIDESLSYIHELRDRSPMQNLYKMTIHWNIGRSTAMWKWSVFYLRFR